MRGHRFSPAERWAFRRRGALGVFLAPLWRHWREVPLVTSHDGAPDDLEHDRAVAVSLARSAGVARVQAVRWSRYGAELLCLDYLGRTVSRRVTWSVIWRHEGRVNIRREPSP